MSILSVAITVGAITPLLIHIVSILYMWCLAILLFFNNLLLTSFTLMWILLHLVFTWLQMVLYSILYPFNALVTLFWNGVKFPFIKLGTFLYKLGTALLSLTQLTLWIVYYGLVLWISCYCMILIYRFLQWRDFAIQGEFYFRPSPHNPNLGGASQRTVTIAPVLLENGRRRVHPPNII